MGEANVANARIAVSSKLARLQGEDTMSKRNIRITLTVLISLGVILAVYTTVQGASFDFAAGQKVGSHNVSGALTNFNHDRLTVAEQEAYQNELDAYNNPAKGSGHGCESESFDSPID
jgi:hypothetical protein